MNSKVQQALNAQINAEFWSAYFYLSMACHFENQGLTGVANWYRVQYREELDHAEIFINYITARGGRVELEPIAAVPREWESPLAAMAATLAHEEKVTNMINELYALAESEHDYATRQKLNWFVAEQVEEEDTVRNLIDKLRLVGNDGTGIYQIDAELAARTYTKAAPLAGTAADA